MAVCVFLCIDNMIYLKMVCVFVSFGPGHAKIRLRAYADSDGPGQPAHLLSDRGLLCPLTESLDNTECMNEEQRPS